jgi:hypothetical protein
MLQMGEDRASEEDADGDRQHRLLRRRRGTWRQPGEVTWERLRPHDIVHDDLDRQGRDQGERHRRQGRKEQEDDGTPIGAHLAEHPPDERSLGGSPLRRRSSLVPPPRHVESDRGRREDAHDHVGEARAAEQDEPGSRGRHRIQRRHIPRFGGIDDRHARRVGPGLPIGVGHDRARRAVSVAEVPRVRVAAGSPDRGRLERNRLLAAGHGRVRYAGRDLEVRDLQLEGVGGLPSKAVAQRDRGRVLPGSGIGVEDGGAGLGMPVPEVPGEGEAPRASHRGRGEGEGQPRALAGPIHSRGDGRRGVYLDRGPGHLLISRFVLHRAGRRLRSCDRVHVGRRLPPSPRSVSEFPGIVIWRNPAARDAPQRDGKAHVRLRRTGGLGGEGCVNYDRPGVRNVVG